MLRDKLFLQGGTLSQAQSRIRELEAEKHGILKEFLISKDAEDERHTEFASLGGCSKSYLSLAHSHSTESKVELLCDRLAVREQEAFGLLSELVQLKETSKVIEAE